MYKICSKCNETKSADGFDKSKKSDDGLNRMCKSCRKIIKDKWANNHPEYNHTYYTTNKNTISDKHKIYYNDNRLHIIEKALTYQRNNKDAKAKYDKQRYQSNRENIIKLNVEYKKKRIKTDPMYRIGTNIRRRINKIIKGDLKKGSAVRDLGCSIEEFKIYLENKFYTNPETGEKMNWENYGYYGWHIDHIKPLSKFDLTNKDQFLKACHYTNLQPLWAKENIKKGSKHNGK